MNQFDINVFGKNVVNSDYDLLIIEIAKLKETMSEQEKNIDSLKLEIANLYSRITTLRYNNE